MVLQKSRIRIHARLCQALLFNAFFTGLGSIGCGTTKFFWNDQNISSSTKIKSSLMNKGTSKQAAAAKGAHGNREDSKPNTKQAQIDFLVVAAEQYEAIEDYRSAMNKYKEVLKLDKNNPIAHHRLALVAIHLSANQQAEDHFREAIKWAPHDEDVCADFAYWKYLNGVDKEAMDEVLHGLADHPDSARLHGIKGLLHSRNQEIDLAIREYQLAGCSTEQAMANLGHIVLMDGNTQTAAYWINKAAEGPSASTAAVKTQKWLGNAMLERTSGDPVFLR
jgi:Tfp pilus assembly protein PilF